MRLLISFLFLLVQQNVFALPDDKLAKLFITSDHWTYNFKTGVRIYEGNVKVDQGSTHITADKLTTKNNAEHQIDEAIAYGFDKTAHYWTTPKPNEKELHAYAKIIKFYPLTSNISLENEVTLSQGENNFNGDIILYNMNDQTITVPASKTGRAVVVYNPEKT